ncbi:hypothetical protein BUALT_Bualt09G0015500 [Buddleja alternifolia]|uniref:Fe2OG dioxygenase domain-containing protein n=1 Tax=Buddleja alternifolia TaxID=168488 RepID=A0AAV6X3L3_9LAMI|nr:hypothetical protein BUALT_Bualt09G0015500 [Buddleja alternifolia]
MEQPPGVPVLGLANLVSDGTGISSLKLLCFLWRKFEYRAMVQSTCEVMWIYQVVQLVLSWKLQIAILKHVGSPEECDYLRATAKPRLQVSTVVDAKTGKGIASKVRTSSGMFLSAEERKYPMIQEIEKRISVYSQVPVENGERIQVLRYEKNQFYRPHHDYFSDTFNVKFGGQRVATMLIYLSDNVEGGETYFPKAGSGECSCGGKMVRGLCVKPLKGDAVLFWSMGLDGQPDPNSLHGGCEVLAGEKWSATKWMRQSTTS